MFGLQIAELPVDTFGCDHFLNLAELLAQQRQLELGSLTTDAVERGLQGVNRRASILDELSTLHVIEKLVVFGVELTPGHKEIELAAVESAFDCGGVFDGRRSRNDPGYGLRLCLHRLFTRHDNRFHGYPGHPPESPGEMRSHLWHKALVC